MKILILMFRLQPTTDPYDPDRVNAFLNYLLPLGLPYISAVLKRAGKDVTCVNLNHRTGLIKDIIKEITEVHYDIVFTGGLSLFYPHLKDTIKYFREFSPLTKIVIGGGILTAQPEIVFRLLEPDFGIVGEGEETALELVNYNDLDTIKGLVYKENGKIIVNQPRPQITDLDSLPFPDYESFGFAEHLDNVNPTTYPALDVVDNPRYYPIVASRSCPFCCTFCMHPVGNKYVQRSIDNIMEELIQNVEKFNINIVIIYDELFTNNMERLTEFCTKFKTYSDTRPEKLWFYCACRVDSTTNEMMKIMKMSGAYLLPFGLESYSQVILNSMRKHTTPEQIKTAIINARNNELGVQGSFIFGDVAETRETANETLNFLKKNHRLMGSAVTSLFIIPFQGSKIYKQCVERGLIKDEVEFVEERARNGYIAGDPMNMTAMSGSEFEALKNDVFEDVANHGVYARGRECGSDVIVQCPWCGWVSNFKNISLPQRGLSVNVGCRHCFYRFDMVGEWYGTIKLMTRLVGLKRLEWLIKLKKGIFG
jgi:radical SAM superfamily enzyme YgiQ (UPF0313 family)